MRRPEDIRAFLAEHRAAWVGKVPTMFGIPMTAAEAKFQRRVLSAGHSNSYLALLGLTATLTFDAGKYFADGDEARRDQNEWHGYHRGLQTALACLIMHEVGCNPRQAALLVVEHTETLIRCRWSEQLEQPDESAEGGG